MTNISIVMADDHPIVRQGLRTLLNNQPNFSLVGEAADGIAVMVLVKKLQPDILVVDLMMPGLSGLDVTRELIKNAVRTKIIILSLYASEVYVMDALRAGASGYVPKDSPEEILVQAINQVASWDLFLAPPLTQRAIEVYALKSKGGNLVLDDSSPFQALTPRERDILQLVLESYSNNDIAARMSISPRTVQSHRANLMRKLNLKNANELFNLAVRYGLLPKENPPT